MEVAFMRCYLKRLRQAARLSQKETACELGISRSFYSMIEIGLRDPDIPLMKKIAELFGDDVVNIFFNNQCNGLLHNTTDCGMQDSA
jgi:putative transcriptional regulator